MAPKGVARAQKTQKTSQNNDKYRGKSNNPQNRSLLAKHSSANESSLRISNRYKPSSGADATVYNADGSLKSTRRNLKNNLMAVDNNYDDLMADAFELQSPAGEASYNGQGNIH